MVDVVVDFAVDGIDVVPDVDITSLNVGDTDWCWVLSLSWGICVVLVCIPVTVTVLVEATFIYRMDNNDLDL